MNAFLLIVLCLFSTTDVPEDRFWAPVLEELEALEHRPLNPNSADSMALSRIPLLTDSDVALLLLCRRERSFRNFADLRRRLSLSLPVARLLQPVFVFTESKPGPSALVTLTAPEGSLRRLKGGLSCEIPGLRMRGSLLGMWEKERMRLAGGATYRSGGDALELAAGNLKGHLGAGVLLDERAGFSSRLELPSTFFRFYPSRDTSSRRGLSASYTVSSSAGS